MAILVLGGAGYIGSHTALFLQLKLQGVQATLQDLLHPAKRQNPFSAGSLFTIALKKSLQVLGTGTKIIRMGMTKNKGAKV